MKYFILTILCLLNLLSAKALAQDGCVYSIKGKVVDCNSFEGLVGTKVEILELQKSQSSNTNGEFEFTNLCKSNYTLSIEYIGYKKITQKIVLTKNIDLKKIVLHNDSLILTEIIISEEKQTIATTQQISSLGTKELTQTMGQSLGETLKKISGVTSLNTGSSISKPVIQGLFGNRIIILNNGIRQEGQQWGSEHAPEIDPFIATKISVIKGAGSVRYGNDAIGGVVLVEPNELRDSSGISGELNLVGMSNGKQGTISGTLEGKFKQLKALSWRAQGTLKKAGNISAPNYILNNTAYEEKNFSAAAKYKLKKVEAELFYSQFNTSIGIFSGSHIGNLTDLQAAFNRARPTDIGSFTYTIARPNQSIQHDLVKAKIHFDVVKNHHIDVVYAFQNNIRMEYDKHRPRNDSLAALNKPELKYEIATQTSDVIWQQKWNNKLNGSFGISSIYQANTYKGRFFIPNFENKGIGAFLIERWHTEKTDLELGIRYDIKNLIAYYRNSSNEILSPSKTYQGFTGNMGITQRFEHHFSGNINLGTSWRNPAPNELYSNGLHHGAASIEIGNSSLQKETAYSLNSSLKFEQKNILKAEITAYYNYIENYIYLKPQLPPQLTIRGAFPAFNFTQTNANFKGIDLNYNWQISEHFSNNSKASLLWAYNVTEKQYLIYTPSNRVETNLQYNFNVKNLKNNYINAGILYVAEQKRVPLNSDFSVAPNAYYLLNAEIGTTLNINKNYFDFIFMCTNILNTSYRDYMNRFRYFTDEMGRNFSLKIKYKFN